MALEANDIAYRVVYLVCLAAAIFMVQQHLRKYLENKDTSSLQFEKFQNVKTNVYPSLTVCFKVDAQHLFEDLTRKDGNFTSQDLASVLKGQPELVANKTKADEILSNVIEMRDGNKIYSNATNGLIVGYEEDYFVHQRSEVIRKNQIIESNKLLTNSSLFFLSYQGPEIRCFTRNLKYEAGLVIRSERMFLDLTSLKQLGLSYTYIYVHYHHQLRRTLESPSLVIRTPTEYNNKTEFMQIRIKTIRVFRKRPNSKEPCDENLLNDDREWMRAVSKYVGCIPVYWKHIVSNYYHLDHSMGQDAPICKTFHTYKQIYSNFITNKWNSTANNYLPPCNKMKVSSDVKISAHNDPYVSKILKSRNLNMLEFLYLTNEYEEIMNVKDVDLEDLFSQIGGSVGILLGYSILQIPSLISIIKHFIVIVYEHLVERKKDLGVGNTAAKIVLSPGKHFLKNGDHELVIMSTKCTEVNTYRYHFCYKY